MDNTCQHLKPWKYLKKQKQKQKKNQKKKPKQNKQTNKTTTTTTRENSSAFPGKVWESVKQLKKHNARCDEFCCDVRFRAYHTR